MKEDLDRALKIMSELGDEKSLKIRAQKFVAAIRPLDSFEEIEQIAEIERGYLESRYPNVSTRIAEISRAGYNKLADSILLSEGMNAVRIGRGKNSRLRHYGLEIICPQDEMRAINQASSDRIDSRISSARSEIRGDEYLAVADRLLNAGDWAAIAAGLIGDTGRRPIEILYCGDFELCGKDDHLMFSGQAKKRGGDNSSFEIPVLSNPKKILKAFKKLRCDPYLVGKISEICQSFDDENERKKKIDSFGNKPINRIVADSFRGVIEVRKGEKQINCRSLRAGYGAILVSKLSSPDHSPSWDLKVIGAVMGHGSRSAATDHYTDYRVIWSPKREEKIVKKTVRLSDSENSEYEKIRDELGLSQPEMMRELIEAYRQLQYQKVAKNATEINAIKLKSMPFFDLFDCQIVGVTNEKLSRIAHAIAEYNKVCDVVEKRWLISSTLLKGITRCNGQDVARWLKSQDWIADHNSEFLPETNEWHNRKCHGSGLYEKCLDDIMEFLG